MLPHFESLDAGMNGNVDTEDVVNKVDKQVQNDDIEESLKDKMKQDNVETESIGRRNY
jgi:hypothetical protein